MDMQDQDRVRAIAEAIVHRAKTDATFAVQLRADPRATVLDAGLPEAVVDDFVSNDLGFEAEVSGYVDCYISCVWSGEISLRTILCD